MKKEFNAPIVETRELTAINNIMDGAMLMSANGVNDSSKISVDVSVDNDYKQWRKSR